MFKMTGVPMLLNSPCATVSLSGCAVLICCCFANKASRSFSPFPRFSKFYRRVRCDLAPQLNLPDGVVFETPRFLSRFQHGIGSIPETQKRVQQ